MLTRVFRIRAEDLNAFLASARSSAASWAAPPRAFSRRTSASASTWAAKQRTAIGYIDAAYRFDFSVKGRFRIDGKLPGEAGLRPGPGSRPPLSPTPTPRSRRSN